MTITAKVLWVVVDRAGLHIVGYGPKEKVEPMAETMRVKGHDVEAREADITERREMARHVLRDAMATCDDCEDGPEEPIDEDLDRCLAEHGLEHLIVRGAEPLTPEEIAEIRARDAARTQGKWFRRSSLSIDVTVESEEMDGDLPEVTVEVMGVRARADAVFIAGMSEDAPRLLATLDARTAERDEARAWVRRLTATERVLTCVYCGKVYPPGSPTHGAEVLTAHIKACPKHPMREVETEVRLLRKAVKEAFEALTDTLDEPATVAETMAVQRARDALRRVGAS